MWAQSRNRIIGRDGVLPWRLPEDLAHFRNLTAGGCVVMGRRTWESLPESFRPLPGRTNFVLTRRAEWGPPGAVVVRTLEDAFDGADGRPIAVIGGLEVFEASMHRADSLEVTEINADFAGDTEAPKIPSQWVVGVADPRSGWHRSATGLEYRFLRYIKAGAEG